MTFTTSENSTSQSGQFLVFSDVYDVIFIIQSMHDDNAFTFTTFGKAIIDIEESTHDIQHTKNFHQF